MGQSTVTLVDYLVPSSSPILQDGFKSLCYSSLCKSYFAIISRRKKGLITLLQLYCCFCVRVFECVVRIHHECEGGIEKHVPTITDR